MENFDFSQLFSQFTQTESLIFLAFCIGAFLIGLLLGYILRGRIVRSLRRQLKDKDQQINQLQEDLQKAQKELSLKDADLKKATYELEESRNTLDALTEEKNQLSKKVFFLNGELEKTQSSSDNTTATVEDLNTQILSLRSRNAQLQEELDATKTKIDTQLDAQQAAQTEIENLKAALETTQTQLVQAQETAAQSKTITPDNSLIYSKNSDFERLRKVEERLYKIEMENNRLQEELDQIRNYPVDDGADLNTRGTFFTPSSDTTSTETEEEEEEEPVVQVKDNKSVLDRDRAMVRAKDRDDLTLIEGIGPFIEKKLNDNGVYTYQHIADFNQADIERITKEIQFFEGRIEKDDWVGQAQKLMKIKDDGSRSLEAVILTVSPEGDELQKIEGIGPKIEAILKEAGITTYEQVAKSDPFELKSILESKDSRFRMADPTTWPAQARLAANGNWDVLQDYQDQLNGGRE